MSRIDPICGMKGKILAHGEWFCSSYCLEKYEKESNLKPECSSHSITSSSLCSPSIPGTELPSGLRRRLPVGVTKNEEGKLWKNKLFLTFLLTCALFLISFFIEQLHSFPHHFLEYARRVWIPLLVGFLIGGWIDVYVPRSYIIKLLAQKSPKTILRATALGFVFSGCSHGCLAIALEIYKKGASIPAVVAFLLASPWANISITLMLFSFFGLKGFLILGGALMISLLTGFTFMFLDKKNYIEKNLTWEKIEDDFSIWQDIQKRWEKFHFDFTGLLFRDFPEILRASCHLMEMVLWWVGIGILLASLIGAVLPESLMSNWFGANLAGMGMTLLAASVIEICSEGSSPLAFEIYRQTQAFGNSFIFLMAGVVTDYTELGLVWTNIGKKTALWMVAVSVPLTLFLGALFNFLF